MKKTFLFFLLILFLSSCGSTYYLSSVKTTSQDIFQSENGEFIVENDSLWISYNFYGADAPIRITVFNKTDIPLYVDWQRSALVIENTAVSYVGKTAKIRGNVNGYSYPSRDYDAELSGSIDIPQTVNFIPPRSKITEIPIRMNVSFDNIAKTEYRKATIGTKSGESLRVKRADYSIDNTPLTFKSYLTVFFQKDKPLVYEDEFYLSCLLKSSHLSPKNLPSSLVKKGDLFYVKRNYDNTFLNIVLATTIIAGATAVEIWTNPQD